MLIAQHFSRYARHDNECPLFSYSILPGDTRCTCKLSEAATIVEQNEQANHNDRDALQSIIDLLEKALPNFKGCPAPTDWAHAAIRELIAQNKQAGGLLRACKAASAFLQTGVRLRGLTAIIDRDKMLEVERQLCDVIREATPQPDNEDAQAILAAQKTPLDPEKIGGLSDIHNKTPRKFDFTGL